MKEYDKNVSIVFIVSLSTYGSWKLKEDNYNKQYVYSSYGNLYYENNNDRTYVETIYDTNNEIIELDIPNEKTVIMYCLKENPSECIYFDMNNSVDQGILNPILNIFVTLLLMAMGLFFIMNTRKPKEDTEEKTSLNSIYLFYVFLFACGIGVLIWQIYNAVNYFNLKNDLNVTTATIYSEIYNAGAENDLYKPVSYYYVDNQKYIYINDSYVDGSLEDNIGTTFELYYNENNPAEVAKKENPIDIWMIIIGILFVAFSTPFVFFKNQMEKRIDKNMSKPINQEQNM